MNDYSFCNKSLPFSLRAKDLVDQMTLEEKALQLGNTAFGVARLGLLSYEWWSEALHGVSNVGPGTRFDKNIVPGATSFPTPILSAAAFNEKLWKTIGQVVSTEARAMFNLGMAGLTYWSPNINVVRDPRWGRAIETPGEDPYVVGRYAVNYVRGLQDVGGYENVDDLNSRPLKVSSCCKHYAAYDVDAWMQVDRYHFDARVSEQDMVETFLRPFEMCVKDGDVSSVMCSYNKINGVPACADNRLLSEKIRGEWDLHGYIVSDCDSIEVMLHGHKWLGDVPEDAISQALEAGLDLDCGSFYPNTAVSAVESGRVKEEEVDKALKNLYVVLMRLGFFDGSVGNYESLGKDDVCSKESIELAAQAAKEGIVLLKNNETLPLDLKKLKKIALVGPHANATDAMIGNYAGIPCHVVSPLDAFSQIVTVDYQMGCEDVHCRTERLIYQAAMAAKHADATIIFAGLDLSVEAESLDRTDLWLPGYQNQLISEVAASAAGPVVLVIFTAGGIDISAIHNNPKIAAIVWAGYPGEQGGNAVADVVFGNYNPGGRLPLTWYYGNYTDELPMTSMQLRPDDELGYPGRTYKFFNGSVVYPFGYGLSYTTFAYTLNSATRSYRTKLSSRQHCVAMNHTDEAIVRPCPAMRIDDLSCNDSIEFEIEVANTGKVDGPHVLLVYSVPPAGLLFAPAKQVVGFERVFVPAGGSVKTSFSLNICKSLSVVKNSGYIVLPSGEHTIVVGDGEQSISFPVQVIYE
ncbi:beta-xylosidase/alpha-L-arabinofuranosidase 1-like [Aristolochia californica]|uniref:beta-xylosidase/alpha-L-arabinofuranosidase 1-like n=1 Tax=Aristolochia californica TaxID=171875 RepID=UPI0035E0EF7E